MGTKDLCANIRHDLIQAFEDLQCCTERKADHNDVLKSSVYTFSLVVHMSLFLTFSVGISYGFVLKQVSCICFSDKTFDSSVKKREPGPKDQGESFFTLANKR